MKQQWCHPKWSRPHKHKNSDRKSPQINHLYMSEWNLVSANHIFQVFFRGLAREGNSHVSLPHQPWDETPDSELTGQPTGEVCTFWGNLGSRCIKPWDFVAVRWWYPHISKWIFQWVIWNDSQWFIVSWLHVILNTSAWVYCPKRPQVLAQKWRWAMASPIFLKDSHWQYKCPFRKAWVDVSNEEDRQLKEAYSCLPKGTSVWAGGWFEGCLECFLW